MDYQRFAKVLMSFASRLVSDYAVGDVLYQLVDAASELLSVSGAGVMLADEKGHLRFVSASDQPVRHIEAIQIELDEGPCLHAYRSGEAVVVNDLAASDRFPQFRLRALEVGFQAVYSFPMRVADDCIGALNLWHDQPGGFDQESIEAGQVLADVATAAILNGRALERSVQVSQQLQSALDSRVIIEQAKGKLSEQLGVPPDQAFQRLRHHARSNGARLAVVAEQVVEGTLDLSGTSEQS